MVPTAAHLPLPLMHSGRPWLPALLGTSVSLLGGLVLLGAWFAPATLQRLLPAVWPMGLGTAAGFLLAGLALALGRPVPDRRTFRHAVGATLLLLASIPAVLLLSGVTESALWPDIRHDLLTRLPAGAQLDAWPGRMSLPATLAFGLCGLALLNRPAHHPIAAQAVMGGIVLLGASAVLMHAFGLAALHQLAPGMVAMSWPTGAGFILLGVGLLLRAAQAPWFRAYYAGREDRKVFASGLAMVLPLILTAWSVGIGQFVSHSVAATQRGLQESLRLNAVLVDDALEMTAAQAQQLLVLSRLEELLAAGGQRQALQAELERLASPAPGLQLRSIRLLAPQGELLAHVGPAARPVQIEVPLGLLGEHRLRWSERWGLASRLRLGPPGRPLGMAEIELGLPPLEKLFATVQRAATSWQFLLCTQANGPLQCFSSHLQPGTAGTPPPRANGQPWPAALALRGEQGVTATVDPLGFDVMAAYAPVGSTGLAALEKIRMAELFGPLQRELFPQLVLMLLLAAGGPFALYLQVRPMVQRLVRLEADRRAVFDHLPSGIAWLDRQRRILGANPALARLFGYGADELVGRDLAQLIPALPESLAAGGQTLRPGQGRHRDGGVRHIEFALTAYAVGEEPRYACIVQDVGEREQASTQLRHWGLIFERARWGVAIGNVHAPVIDTMNQEFARMHGYTVEELSGRPIADLFAPEVRAEVPQYLRRVHEQGHHQFESLHLRKDGTVFPVLIDVTAVRDERGEVAFRVANVQDISERKQQEAALWRSEALLRRVLETLPIGVWIADATGRIMLGNEAGRRIWGGARLVGPERYGEYEARRADTGRRIEAQEWALARALRHGATALNEVLQIRGFDGSHKTILNSAVPLRGPDGAIEGAIAVNEDITAQRQAQEELRLSKELFQTTFDAAAVGLALYDLDGRYRLINPALCATLGYSEEELRARSLADLTLADDLPRVMAANQRLLSGESRVYQLETQACHKQGQTLWVLLSVTLVHDAQGAPASFIGQITDITPRKQMEEELLRSRQQLRELAAYRERVREDERKRIAREVHDELGQQLTALRMRLSLLARPPRDAAALAAQLTDMRLLLDRMVGMVRHVASNLRPATLDLGLAPALEWLAQDFERHSGIRCRCRLVTADDAAADTLALDDSRATALFRIVQEALTNVARHAEADEVNISLKAREDGISLRVSDNGRGFDPARVDTRRSLGLLGMRERMLILHGELQIHSAAGEGTTVAVELPHAPAGSDPGHGTPAPPIDHGVAEE